MQGKWNSNEGEGWPKAGTAFFFGKIGVCKVPPSRSACLHFTKMTFRLDMGPYAIIVVEFYYEGD